MGYYEDKPLRIDRIRFELYEWFTQVVLEQELYQKCKTEEVIDLCVKLGNLFEEEIYKLSYDATEEIYFDTFPESDIDNGGLL